MGDIYFKDVENPLLRAYNRLMYLRNLTEVGHNTEHYLSEFSRNARGEMEIVYEFIMAHGEEYTRKIVQGELLENRKVVDWIDL